jgi:hypothetical protein
LGEHGVRNAGVGGSNPPPSTNSLTYLRMRELPKQVLRLVLRLLQELDKFFRSVARLFNKRALRLPLEVLVMKRDCKRALLGVQRA